MKKLLLFCLFVFAGLLAKAQQDTTKQKEEYCILTASPRFANVDKVHIEIDLGNEIQLLKYSGQQIKDQQDSVKKFHSPVDALNYMAKQGWILSSTYVVSPASNSIIYHFVMRRPISLSK